MGVEQGLSRAREVGPLGRFRVDRDLSAVAQTGQQADQLPSPWDNKGRGSHHCSGS